MKLPQNLSVIVHRSKGTLWSPHSSHWPFQPKLDGVRDRNEPAAQYGSSPDSPLEGAGFEPSVPLVPAPNAPSKGS
jgi:hypothetical protein